MGKRRRAHGYFPTFLREIWFAGRYTRETSFFDLRRSLISYSFIYFPSYQQEELLLLSLLYVDMFSSSLSNRQVYPMSWAGYL